MGTGTGEKTGTVSWAQNQAASQGKSRSNLCMCASRKVKGVRLTKKALIKLVEIHDRRGGVSKKKSGKKVARRDLTKNVPAYKKNLCQGTRTVRQKKGPRYSNIGEKFWVLREKRPIDHGPAVGKGAESGTSAWKL